MNKLRLATVFSGIGAVEFALKRLNINYKIVFACDNGEREIDYDHNLEYQKIKKLSSIKKKKEYVDNLYLAKTTKKNYVETSYLNNFNCPKSRYFQDICLLDGTDFTGKVDLLVGGSPCQSFSAIGCQNGLDDPRGNLFFEFTRLIKEIQPKVFIYENVRNLLNHNKGNT
ncbi:DNA (cytosine-5-)-methyltransferase [bacterium]|nr:DNA (cytosine-5-)-methyltransferase [bacterium]